MTRADALIAVLELFRSDVTASTLAFIRDATAHLPDDVFVRACMRACQGEQRLVNPLAVILCEIAEARRELAVANGTAAPSEREEKFPPMTPRVQELVDGFLKRQPTVD